MNNKPIPINNDIRDLLLSRYETYPIDRNSCMYLGKTYTYMAVTKEEIQRIMDDVEELLEEKTFGEWVRGFFKKEKQK